MIIGVNKGDRTVIALTASIICYVVIVYFEGANPNIFAAFLIGTTADNYDNLHALILIFSMLAIVEIAKDGGMFQFLAMKLVKLTRGLPKLLMVIICLLTWLIGAILSDILTVIVLSPLTITICRTLGIDPRPYVTVQLMVVKVGAITFLISSITDIVISTVAGINFVEFFLNIGLVSIPVLLTSIIVFLAFFRNRLPGSTQGLDILLKYDAWSFVSNRSLMKKSLTTLIIIMTLFITVPSSFLSPDIIALMGAIVLFLISNLDVGEIFRRVDFKFILYLLGIFIVTGALQYVGVIDFLASSMSAWHLPDAFTTFVVLLWLSGYFSGPVDNVAIMRVMIPIAQQLTTGYSSTNAHLAYYGVIFGVNLGDNLTPLGDSMLGIQLSEQNKEPLSFREFFVIGFILTNLQLLAITIVYSFIYDPYVAVILLGILVLILYTISHLRLKDPYENAPYGLGIHLPEVIDDDQRDHERTS